MLRFDDLQEPNFGCFGTDFGCYAQEAIARFMWSTIKNLGDLMADMFGNAFELSMIDESSWSVADGQFWFWVSVMSIVLLFVALPQIATGILLQDGRRIAQVALGLAFAVPASALGVYFMKEAVAFGDSVTASLIDVIQNEGMAGALLRVFGYNVVSDGSISPANESYLLKLNQMSTAASGVGQYALVLCVVGLVALAAVFLFIAMAIRSFGLLALAATAPIGLMMVGQPVVAVWARRWVSLAVGLILAKPLAAGILILAVNIVGESTSIPNVLIAVVAVFAAAFSPLWAVKLVSFAGDGVGDALQRRASMRDQVSRGSTVVNVFKGFKR